MSRTFTESMSSQKPRTAAAQLTILNSMASYDIVRSLDQHVEWGLRWVDLKDGIFGRKIEALDGAQAERVAGLILGRKLHVYCLSSVLMGDGVELGEAHFRAEMDSLETLLETARIIRPRFIRLLAPQTSKRPQFANSIDYIRRDLAWLPGVFREAIDRINDAGFKPIIENEVGACILSTADEIVDFFNVLERPNRVSFTWDVQNLWQMGSYPTTEIYARLKPILGMIHVKGGQSDRPKGPLKFRTTLEDASWPVAEIVNAVVGDRASPVICVNSSHGAEKPGYDYADIVARDLAFLRTLDGIE